MGNVDDVLGSVLDEKSSLSQRNSKGYITSRPVQLERFRRGSGKGPPVKAV
jgi:hypothetical protein